MKVLIFSDSHGNTESMSRVIDEYSDIKYIIHAGDILSDVYYLKNFYPDKNIIFVRGNNDYLERNIETEKTFTLFGKKIFLTHGHNLGVKYSPYKMFAKTRELGADIGIFGHTHSRFSECMDGIYLFNPGSSVSSAGLLDLSDNEIKFLFLYK